MAQPARGGDPKASVAVYRKTRRAVLQAEAIVTAGKSCEMQSVKAGQPAQRTDPEKSIGRLLYCRDEVLRKALVGSPRGERVVSHLFGRHRR